MPWPRAPALGDMPLVVLTCGLPPRQDEMPTGATAELLQQMQVVWQELQEEHAALSSNSHHIIPQNSGHFIQIDRPRLVIEALKWVVDQAR